MQQTDFLVIGSGIAGLTYALKVAAHFPDRKVLVMTKATADETNTKYAQGGIAVVNDMENDSFEKHIEDTLIAGDGLCSERVVEIVVKEGPDRVQEIIDWGARFDKEKDGDYKRGKEGGHSESRILHHKDVTGKEMERALIEAVANQKNIEFIPLVRHPPPARPSPDGEGGGEEVVGSDVGCNLLVVESGNYADACVVLILVEQFLAEAEERDGRHVVILKHDTFVRQGECPLLCHVFRWVAAVVLLLVVVVYFAFPVDVCHYFATSFYARHVTLAARAVLIEKQSCGACLLHLFEYLRQQFGAVEEKNQYRYIYKGWFHGNGFSSG